MPIGDIALVFEVGGWGAGVVFLAYALAVWGVGHAVYVLARGIGDQADGVEMIAVQIELGNAGA